MDHPSTGNRRDELRRSGLIGPGSVDPVDVNDPLAGRAGPRRTASKPRAAHHSRCIVSPRVRPPTNGQRSPNFSRRIITDRARVPQRRGLAHHFAPRPQHLVPSERQCRGLSACGRSIRLRIPPNMIFLHESTPCLRRGALAGLLGPSSRRPVRPRPSWRRTTSLVPSELPEPKMSSVFSRRWRRRASWYASHPCGTGQLTAGPNAGSVAGWLAGWWGSNMVAPRPTSPTAAMTSIASA